MVSSAAAIRQSTCQSSFERSTLISSMAYFLLLFAISLAAASWALVASSAASCRLSVDSSRLMSA